MKIEQLQYICDSNLDGIEQSVNDFITHGWIPLGGLVIREYEDTRKGNTEYLYIQTMIKYVISDQDVPTS